MRNLEKSKDITQVATREKLPVEVVQLDVDEDSSVKQAVDKIVATEDQRIDVLVNNAGYGLFGALEDLSIAEMKAQFETNFFGVIRVTQQVIPVIKKLERSFKAAIVNTSASSTPEVVAKVVVQAITSESPKLRYTVGNDAASTIQARTTLSDTEFG